MWCPKDYHLLNKVLNNLFECAEHVQSLVVRDGEPIGQNHEKLLRSP